MAAGAEQWRIETPTTLKLRGGMSIRFMKFEE
jgi:hypothetical protein